MTESPAPEMWRVRTDSSDLAEPRVLIRAFLEPGRLDPGIAFYERLQGVTADARFSYPEAGLRLAVVGAFLLIEGDREAVAPFLATAGTLLVDDVHPYHDRLVAEGAEITDPPKKVPTGTGFSARHPDGTVVEYVHHRPTADGR
ncbi:VOC family protein [Nocardiopsis composta]|uniref:Putative enzyme related to lactoylglutathione lyase n=1 Tax=Nocardiopsis composta TaxID=157465 RepID=A0A7W8QGV0_9ACTN|nr:VOC family protein [Nocardiopsis composta]MBB5430111.1 putative enzyme related to lactoylglutathione lyase [Nocardiopsis composta]